MHPVVRNSGILLARIQAENREHSRDRAPFHLVRFGVAEISEGS
jgi:hypothetical protein